MFASLHKFLGLAVSNAGFLKVRLRTADAKWCVFPIKLGGGHYVYTVYCNISLESDAERVIITEARSEGQLKQYKHIKSVCM